jgi:hypothetical protein
VAELVDALDYQAAFSQAAAYRPAISEQRGLPNTILDELKLKLDPTAIPARAIACGILIFASG